MNSFYFLFNFPILSNQAFRRSFLSFSPYYLSFFNSPSYLSSLSSFFALPLRFLAILMLLFQFYTRPLFGLITPPPTYFLISPLQLLIICKKFFFITFASILAESMICLSIASLSLSSFFFCYSKAL